MPVTPRPLRKVRPGGAVTYESVLENANMPLELKIMITAVVVLSAPLILFLNIKAGPDSHWRCGRYDPFRIILFRENGTLRRYSKLGILLWLAVALTGIWMFL